MFRVRLNKSTFPALGPAFLGLIMLVIGPCLTCPCLESAHAETPFVDSSGGSATPSPCECCDSSPKNATPNHSRTHQRQLKEFAGLTQVPTVAFESPVRGIDFIPARPVRPSPGHEELQVFLE